MTGMALWWGRRFRLPTAIPLTLAVGRTPWSAADALVRLFVSSRNLIALEKASAADARTGGPHNLCRIPK